MNNFTKDELETIFDSVMFMTEPTDDTLLTKIQSLIDNYCEHDNDFRFNAMPLSGSPKLCTKCEMFYI